jgi:hypothetical protein
VKLDTCGDPIHTRILGVGLLWRADGRLDLQGQLLDLRKRGCVPVAGGLQGSGLVHQVGVGSFPDACYMWRRGGALDTLRGGAAPSNAPKESGAR